MSNWLIIPTYNESLNIKELIARINQNGEWQILVVDDDSPDDTSGVVRNLQKKYSNIFLFTRVGKLGLGSAYRVGFKYALDRGAEMVGEMDADLSHLPEDLSKLYQVIKSGADLAIGSRRVGSGKVEGWSAWRHFTSFSAMLLARIVLGLKTKDVTSGFRLYTKKALNSIPWADIKSDGYAFQEEILFLCERAGLKVVEVPVVFVDRRQGKSKLGIKSIIEFFATLVRLRIVSFPHKRESRS